VAKIDPTARVADGACLGANVEIGPYCVIGPEAVVGDGCQLHAHVVVSGVTTIGARTIVYPFAALGTPPQSIHYRGERTKLVIGADCVVREGVTMNTGTANGRGETRVGDRCFLMTGAHVGHDCIVGSHVTFANNATLGGHAEIGEHVFLGGLCAVHQFNRVGEHAVVGGLVGVTEDVIPFGAAIGHRAELAGLNLVGLKRRGFSRDDIHSLRRAYRMLFFGEGALLQRVEAVAKEFAADRNVQRIVEFIRSAGKRRVALPRELSDDEEP
jgi:UDP-N-acetylglucosamine acyltransferase